AVSDSSAMRLPEGTTWAPCPASPRASARPSPVVPPMTTATRSRMQRLSLIAEINCAGFDGDFDAGRLGCFAQGGVEHGDGVRPELQAAHQSFAFARSSREDHLEAAALAAHGGAVFQLGVHRLEERVHIMNADSRFIRRELRQLLADGRIDVAELGFHEGIP